jgi:hypothetical protein
LIAAERSIDRGMAVNYPVCAGATPPKMERAIKQAK